MSQLPMAFHRRANDGLSLRGAFVTCLHPKNPFCALRVCEICGFSYPCRRINRSIRLRASSSFS